MNEFGKFRELLGHIRRRLRDRGFVGVSWDGSALRVTHARPDTGKPMWVMTFDDPGDVHVPVEVLVSEFVASSNRYFGPLHEDAA